MEGTNTSMGAPKKRTFLDRIVQRINPKTYLRKIYQLCDLVLADYYSFKSAAIRKVSHYTARRMGDFCANKLDSLESPVYRIYGDGWRFLFIGPEKSKAALVRIFPEEFIKEEDLGVVARRELASRLAEWIDPQEDIVICEHPEATKPTEFLPVPVIFSTPIWVDQVLVLPDSPEKLKCGKSRRNYINRCIKEGYISDFSHEIADFNFFYDQVYLPFISMRHGNRTFVSSRAELEKLFLRGGLLCIKHNNKMVAGCLCYISSNTFFENDLGILLEGPKCWQMGSTALLNWYMFLLAYDMGLTHFNLGGSRSWHSDGVFQYKSSWGARVSRRSRINRRWTFLSHKTTPSLRKLINSAGFLTEGGDSLLAVYLTDEASDTDFDDIGNHLATAQKRGVEGLLLKSPASEEVLTEAANPNVVKL